MTTTPRTLSQLPPEELTPLSSWHRPTHSLLPAAWPIYGLFVGLYLWWVLGLGGFIQAMITVPLLFVLLWRGGRLEVPRRFWLCHQKYQHSFGGHRSELTTRLSLQHMFLPRIRSGSSTASGVFRPQSME